MSSIASNEEKVLGRGDLVALAIGNVVGGGIMSMTGIAIGMTGRSIILAIAICSIMVLVAAIPQFFVSSTIRMNGGFYTQAALFSGKWFAGIYAVIWISFFFGASFYSLSFASYVLSFIPGASVKLVAMLVLAGVVGLNLIGIKIAARAQYIMVILLVLALLGFAGFGFGHVKPGYTAPPDFLTRGAVGIMAAASLMSFATSGSTFIVNFGRQCKNPTKDIPFAIVVSTIIVTILYIGVAYVAAGVLPVAEVANKSLALVAFEILPYPLYLFFIVCGAMIALVTSLNACIGWITPPIVQASHDGWFPKVFGKMNDRFKTPHWTILFIFALSSMIILFDWQIGTVATVGNFLANVANGLIILALIRMPDVVPDLWKKSQFHVSNTIFKVFCLLGALMSFIFCYYLGREMGKTEIIGIFIYLGIAIIYPAIRIKLRKDIHIETSYEEA